MVPSRKKLAVSVSNASNGSFQQSSGEKCKISVAVTLKIPKYAKVDNHDILRYQQTESDQWPL